MRIPWLLIFGAAGALYLFKKAKKAYDYVEFNPLALKKGTLGIFSTQVQYVFQIKNPTTATATIKNIIGKILAGSSQVGTFQIPKTFTIPAQGAVNITTEVNLSNLDFVTAMVKAIAARKTPEITFAGEVATGLGTFPFNYTALVQQDLTLKKK